MNLLYPNAIAKSAVSFKEKEADNMYAALHHKGPLKSTTAQITKRAFDIIFSLGIIVFVFSWLFPIVAVLIKLSSKGPVFFKQKRHGLNNELFDCLKFRTMRVNTVEGKQASKHDPRITRVGSFLRKTSIDEFPQFLNVLMGDMSVVGPRPHFCEHNEEFAKHVKGFMCRHAVKPGVTGLAQTRGYRGETNTLQAVTGRFKLDVFYIANWSFWLDVKITFNTFFGMLLGDKQAY